MSTIDTAYDIRTVRGEASVRDGTGSARAADRAPSALSKELKERSASGLTSERYSGILSAYVATALATVHWSCERSLNRGVHATGRPIGICQP
jgi:hypothetical protein